VIPFINESGALHVKIKLPLLPEGFGSAEVFGSEEALDSARNVSQIRSNTIRMEVTLNTPAERDGIFRLWYGGQLVREDMGVLYRYYDDIFVRSLVMRAAGDVALYNFKYWVGCDVPVQYVAIDDVFPGTYVVELADDHM
jgi:hypothetical protein